jgi:hypothetical protein
MSSFFTSMEPPVVLGAPLTADAHAGVDGGAEPPEVAELGVDDRRRLEDGVPLAEERILVARAEDDRRDDREPEPAAGRVQEPELRVNLDVTQALVAERPLLRGVRARILRAAVPGDDTHRDDDPELYAQVGELREPHRALQRRAQQGVDDELGRLRGVAHVPAVEHQRTPGVRGDEAERELELPQDRRRVHGDEPFRVHRRPENLQVDRGVCELGVSRGGEAGEGREHGGLDQPSTWANDHEHLR